MKQVTIFSGLILLSMLWAGRTAQSDDCTNVLVSMSPCLDFISGNSSGPPAAACCTQLGTVARSHPTCLCQVVNGGGPNLGLTINQTQALALPKACNVQTPPPSRCKVASPSGSPAGSTSPKKNSGDDSKTVVSLSLPFFLLFTSFVSMI